LVKDVWAVQQYRVRHYTIGSVAPPHFFLLILKTQGCIGLDRNNQTMGMIMTQNLPGRKPEGREKSVIGADVL